MKQSAVEWLLEQLENQVSDDGKQTMSLKVTGFLREQAKEMEKQQQGYSEEEVYNILIIHTIELFKKEPITLENFWNKFKKK